MFLRIVFENAENIILVFFENYFNYLNFVFFVFFITKKKKKQEPKGLFGFCF